MEARDASARGIGTDEGALAADRVPTPEAPAPQGVPASASSSETPAMHPLARAPYPAAPAFPRILVQVGGCMPEVGAQGDAPTQTSAGAEGRVGMGDGLDAATEGGGAQEAAESGAPASPGTSDGAPTRGRAAAGAGAGSRGPSAPAFACALVALAVVVAVVWKVVFA